MLPSHDSPGHPLLSIAASFCRLSRDLREHRHPCHDIGAVVVPGGVQITVSIARSCDGISHAAVVTAGGDLQLLVGAHDWESPLGLLNISGNQPRTERD